MIRIRTTAVLTALLLVTGTVAAQAATDHIAPLAVEDFALTPNWSLAAKAAELEAAMGTRRSLATVLDDANRSTTTCTSNELQAQPQFDDRPDNVPNLTSSDRFCWDRGDSEVPYWMPQGVTGSSDADDDGLWGPDKVLAVSWYYDRKKDGNPPVNKGVRVSFVDRSTGKYRHVLLVEPTGTADFKPVPIHAGGLAWLGRHLYVADTSRGLRVFDMERILEVRTDGDPDWYGKHGVDYYAFDYRYVLPQVATYQQSVAPPSPCSPQVDALCFSSLALDRSTTPDTLVVGEYRNGRSTNPAIDGGRVVRYQVDATDERKLTLTAGKAVPQDAVAMPKSNIQGVQTWQERYYLSTSNLFQHGYLHTKNGSTLTTRNWGIGPEDLYHEHGPSNITAGQVWTATEHAYNTGENPDNPADDELIDRRVVFAVPLNDMS